jgi:hypothetical protein
MNPNNYYNDKAYRKEQEARAEQARIADEAQNEPVKPNIIAAVLKFARRFASQPAPDAQAEPLIEQATLEQKKAGS